MIRTKSWITSLLILLTVTLGLVGPTASLAQEASSASVETEATTPSNLDLLLQVIENDDSRAALIDELRAAQTESETPADDKIVETLAPEGDVPPEGLSFGRRIALITQEVAEDAASSLESAWHQITMAPQVFSGLNGSEAGVLLEALKELALVIVVTVVVFLGLRRMGKSLYGRMGATAQNSGIVRTVALFLASVVIDALIVVIAWAVGYLIATLFLGNFGQIAIRQTLYLNAFLLVELAKVAVRMVLSPSARYLRPMPISNEAAKYLTRRLNFMVGLVGYGQLLIVPIINTNASFAAGRAVSALIALIVVSLAIWMVLRNRRDVAAWLERGGQSEAEYAEEQEFHLKAEQEEAALDAAVAEPAEDREGVETVTTMREEFPMGTPEKPKRRANAFEFLVRHWHWPVLLYLVSMLVVVLVQPGDAAFRSMLNSAQVLVVALLGVMLSGVLTRVMVRGVQLPDNVTARLPLLEKRLNTFVPKALFVLRFVIFVMVVVFALNAISVIDLKSWMASQFGLQVTSKVFSVAAVLLVSFAIWVALTSWVDYRLNPEFGSVATSRERTLLTLLRNAATIALIIITAMFVLSEIGLDIAPLLASAGVLGLAIGFGAQKMVQDIITGIFIQFENAMNVGDVVTVGGTTGSVERLTIRSVSLRDVTGAFHVIPFSSVDMVTNYVREFGYSVCDMGVAYRENIAEVKQAMVDAFEQLRADPEQAKNIMGDLEWFGLNSFGDSAMVVRTRIKCVAGTQWGVGRAYNGVLKEIFDERNIEIPFPHQTIYLGEAKDGKTQPFLIRKDDGGNTGGGETGGGEVI
ncbi:mechanosensitive ion channel domain-containing protein [Maritimibacter alkaliphilus]|uniref:mechanosensitive ion channel domain-containing protein n=1 Tax=Maritimibacter alkaliphilus TaxID=404236 RepID=UPI001C950EF3|nr:mechanosensitive ion channel domain-containing protein [Maritimibacter alkaliphilus]MBY6092233.1 mechanosensitive ion channel [Maritimibacter alkaliphilus]